MVALRSFTRSISVSASHGPVAVTGASGYIGSWTVNALLQKGYVVHGCVTDASNPEKTQHLVELAKNAPGELKLFSGNLLEPGSYDASFAGCTAVFHVATAMGYGGKNKPVDVYHGTVDGTKNVIGSIKQAGTVKRVVYTSSFAAVGHPAPPGYLFTEADWAYMNREKDKNWTNLFRTRPESWDAETIEMVNKSGDLAYAMSKVETEEILNQAAEEDGSFDNVTVCPCVVLGPLLSTSHELVGSWQWVMGRMLAGKSCVRGWQNLWNIVDVRDVGEAQALIAESAVARNGTRYNLSAKDRTAEINVWQLQAHLKTLFPNIDVGGEPKEMDDFLKARKGPVDVPRGHSSKAQNELGLKPHAIEDTLYQTGKTMIELDLVKPAWRNEAQAGL